MTDTTDTKPDRPVYTLDLLKAHQTYLNAAGEKVPGVTTILGILDKLALKMWAWNLGKQGISMQAALKAAADIGTIAHAKCEAWLRGMDFDDSPFTAEQVAAANNSADKFRSWWIAEKLQLEDCEKQMVSELWQCGGTADIIAYREKPKRRLLIDLKTGKGIYREMRLQTAAYAAMYEADTMRRINEVWIVRIGKEAGGDVEPVQVLHDRDACVDAFGKCAALYHALKYIK